MRLPSVTRSLRGGAGAVGARLWRPQSLSMVRRRAQPTVATIIRLTVTAVAAFAVAYPITGDEVLAPLTALLVVQVTLYHTFRSALQRVVSVISGVVIAVGLSRALGFTWWSLGITIAAALTIGYVLRLGGSILEVPISAMLILSLPTDDVVSDRIVATLLGAATGLASNLVFAPLRVGPAEEAVDDLGRRLADLLDQVADDLSAGRGPQAAAGWVARSRALTGELDRVEDTLGQAEESVRLNPRGGQVIDPRVHLRRRLQALQNVTLTVRGIARSLNDSIELSDGLNPVRDPEATRRVAEVLRELAAVLRPYGQLARTQTDNRDALKADVDRHLAQAGQRQQAAAEVLRTDPSGPSSGWPLRGELVSHLDRLRTMLEPPPPQAGGPRTAAPDPGRPVRAVGGWLRRLRPRNRKQR
jgi:uncharacterized membrane protein YgaE (UPF0421/DUF939 family)